RIDVATPSGVVSYPAPPARSDATPPRYGAVPALGEHTAKIWAEFLPQAKRKVMRHPRRMLGVFPSPLWGGVRGGGDCVRQRRRVTAPPPSPALPHKGGGSIPSSGREQTECGDGVDGASGEGLGARVVVDCAQNVLEHAIDIRQDIVVPIAQHAIAVRLENSRAVIIGG